MLTQLPFTLTATRYAGILVQIGLCKAMDKTHFIDEDSIIWVVFQYQIQVIHKNNDILI